VEHTSKKRLVIILGAGASIEFFSPITINGKKYYLTTQDITNLCTDFSKRGLFYSFFKKLFQKHALFCGQPVDLYFDAFARLVSSIVLCFNRNNRNYNFEDIAHLLDKVSDILVDNKNFLQIDSVRLNIDSVLIEIFGGGLEFNKYIEEIANYIPRIYRHFIWYIFYKFSGTLIKDTLEIWGDFLEYATANNYKLSIYSLNYDPLIYEVLRLKEIKHCDGFSEEKEKKLFFKSAKFVEEKGNIYAPLHGSIYFCYNKNGIHKTYDLEKIENQIFYLHNFPSEYRRNQDETYNYNINLITGFYKSDVLLYDPFSTYYLRFANDLYESDKIIIIGYGGRDNHLNALLKAICKLQKPMLIIDYDDICKNRCYFHEFGNVPPPLGKRICQYNFIEPNKNFINSCIPCDDIEVLSSRSWACFKGTKKFLKNKLYKDFLKS